MPSSLPAPDHDKRDAGRLATLTPDRVRHELERTLQADELTALFAFLREAPDTKRDDALLLLEEMC